MQYPHGLLECLVSSINGVIDQCELKESNSAEALKERDGEIYSATIGFTGDLKGAITIGASAKTLQATNPLPWDQRTVPVADNVDWIGEIVNQVIGGLKREVSRYGANFDVGIPAVDRGKDISMRIQGAKAAPSLFNFEAGGHEWKMLFLCEIAPEVSFDAPKDDAVLHNMGDKPLFF